MFIVHKKRAASEQAPSMWMVHIHTEHVFVTRMHLAHATVIAMLSPAGDRSAPDAKKESVV
jgi:hypothetical protein